MMNQPEMGIKIAELRKTKGITQEELALKCNINVRTIQRIETGSVTPRSFTLNLIYSSLDYKIEEKPITNKFKLSVYENINQLISGNFENIPIRKITNSFIKYAWIAGIIYFLIGFGIAGLDFLRSKDNLFITGKVIYILLKLLIIVSAYYYFGGFVVIGSKFKNHVLVISSLITIFAIALFSFYDIISLFYNSIEKQTIDGGRSITFGIIGIVFGIGLIRLNEYYGLSASLAGIFNIIEGCFFLTLILWFVGVIFTIPSEIFEIIILYKAYKYPKLLENKIV
jgi:transcriptional regulator with XRE-family HTH domain